MNKKALFVPPTTIIKGLRLIIVGIGLWFIYSGTKELINNRFSITPIQSVGIGLGIVIAMFIIFKYGLLKKLLRLLKVM